MSVLVTGAAGFIGSHVCEALLAKGERVVGLDNFDEFYDPRRKERNLRIAREHGGFTLCRGDVRSAEDLSALPDDIGAVVHLAARAGVRPSIQDPDLYTDVNVMGTTRLLTWMRRRGVRTLVFASSSSVYGDNEKVPFSEDDRVDNPISPYAATKKACELLCHAASHLDGIGISCLRFFTIYGPRQRPDLAIHKFSRALLEGCPISMYGDGNSSRDYTYIDDAVDGILRSLEWTRQNEGEYRIFNLGHHRPISLSEMIQIVSEEIGIAPTIESLPAQPGDVERTFADIARAREVLGWTPKTEFRTGVRRFVEWIRADRAEEAASA